MRDYLPKTVNGILDGSGAQADPIRKLLMSLATGHGDDVLLPELCEPVLSHFPKAESAPASEHNINMLDVRV